MKTRVFLVEDHEVVLDSFVMLIDSTGQYEICGTAHSAEQALDSINEANAELLMIDLSLPGMNGIDLVRTLRIRGVRLPMLVLTGHDKDMYRQAALKAGADSYVTKAAGPEKLLEAMRTAIEAAAAH